MRQPAVALLLTSVSSVPDPQQHQTLSNCLEVTARRPHGAADPATPVTADDYAAAKLEALRQAQRDSFPDESTQLTTGKPVAKSHVSCHSPQSSTGQKDSSEWEAISATAVTLHQTRFNPLSLTLSIPSPG